MADRDCEGDRGREKDRPGTERVGERKVGRERAEAATSKSEMKHSIPKLASPCTAEQKGVICAYMPAEQVNTVCIIL